MFGFWDQDKRLDITREIEGALPGIGPRERRELFEPIAWRFHTKGVAEGEEEQGGLLQELSVQLAEVLGSQPNLQDNATRLLKHTIERSGLFESRSGQTVAMRHHTFQEYLAARHLAYRDDFIPFINQERQNSWWREVILLTVGHLTAENNKVSRQRAGELVLALARAGDTPDEQAQSRLLAGRCLVDVAPTGVAAQVRDEVKSKLTEMTLAAAYTTYTDQTQDLLGRL